MLRYADIFNFQDDTNMLVINHIRWIDYQIEEVIKQLLPLRYHTYIEQRDSHIIKILLRVFKITVNRFIGNSDCTDVIHVLMEGELRAIIDCKINFKDKKEYF